MNEQLIKIGLESGMLNYVDNETPRHYFLSGHADEQDLAKFAELIVLECADTCLRMQLGNQYTPEEMLFQTKYRNIIKKHFGVEE